MEHERGRVCHGTCTRLMWCASLVCHQQPFSLFWDVWLLCAACLPGSQADGCKQLDHLTVAKTPLNVTARGPWRCRSERIFQCAAAYEQSQRGVNCHLLGLKLQQLGRFAGMILSWYRQLMFGQDVADRLVLTRLE